MQPLYAALILVSVFLVILGAIFLDVARRKALAKAHQSALEASGPTNWVSIGVAPPPGLSVALEVIQAAYPHLPDRGTIEWVTEPFPISGYSKVAGTVLWYKPVHVKLMTGPRVEETALAHEMLHVEDLLAGRSPRESPRDVDFVAEFQAVNAAIKKALST